MTTTLTPNGSTLGATLPLAVLNDRALTLVCYLGFLVVAIAALAPSTASMIKIWVAAPSYAHGVFAAPLAIALLVLRRTDWPDAASVRWPGFLTLAGASALLILGRAAGLGAVEHIAIAGIAIAGFIAICGLAPALRHAPSLALFALAPPLGDILAAPLQAMTVAAVAPMLMLLSVDAIRDANVFTTDAHVFAITDACSGLNIFTASLMTACAMAAIGLESHRARALLVAAAAGLAVVANWLRVALVIAAAEAGLISDALLRDHAFAGAAAFTAVVIVLAMLTTRLDDRQADGYLPPSPRLASTEDRHHANMATMRRAALVAMAVVILAGAYGRLIIDRSPPTAIAVVPEITIDGWRSRRAAAPISSSSAFSHFDVLETHLIAAEDQRAWVMVAALHYDRQGHEAAGYETDGAVAGLPTAPIVRYWLGGKTYRSANAYRVALMRARLMGRRPAAGVVLISPIDDASGSARAALNGAAIGLRTPSLR